MRVRADGDGDAGTREGHEQVVAGVEFADRLAQARGRHFDQNAGLRPLPRRLGVEVSVVENVGR